MIRFEVEPAHHPVNQEKKGSFPGGASIAAQKYGPPLVGTADTISAMPSATMKAVKSKRL